MDQNSEQLNIYATGEAVDTKRNRMKIWDVILWVLIFALAIAVLVRAFVVSKVTISGESMTAAYYNEESSDYYNPDLTYHDGRTVTVNKLKKPKRGDVVVFYKHPVKSKFLALFAHGDSVSEEGEYYKLIKRVVALEGDKLWLENINDGKYRLVIQTPGGDILHEDYYQKNGETLSSDCFVLSISDNGGLGNLAECTQQNPLVIEEGHFFAMGDNRAKSADSRGNLGQVPLSQLFGVVVRD